MAYLQIIRASAGSGKTFALTGEYLKLIINEPLNYYRQILAVTFTNKATAEMKSRILEELYLLATGSISKHLENLKRETNKDEGTIRDKAKAVLNYILHGYSWFRVETIDSFFQGVIRAFIHELGIPGNQRVELDTDIALDLAIDRFLESLGTNKQVTDWLLEYVQEKINDGKSWNVKNELKNLGNDLFKEKIKLHSQHLEEILNDENVKSYRNRLYVIKNSFENTVKNHAVKALAQITNNGYNVEDFAYGISGAAGYFVKLSKNIFEKPKKRAMDVLDDPEKWTSKKAPSRNETQSFAITKLSPPLSEIVNEFDTHGAVYFSALAVLKNFHVLGILFKLLHELREVQKEKNIFFISDAAPFIHRIINNNDTPFIYEKVGNRFNHILIDEFQDTSEMQWKNFSPLLSNSLSMGHECLLVGDIKQSIYRWRNSDWEILAHKVKDEFPAGPVNEKILQYNRRSNPLIVEFNNKIFSSLPEIAKKIGDGAFQKFFPIESVYSGAMQLLPENVLKNSGYVRLKRVEVKAAKDDEGYFREELFSRINEMLATGFNPGDIAILVRTKGEGAIIAKEIIEAGKNGIFTKEVGVISNESLLLSGSDTVKFLVSALKFIFNPGDKLASASLISGYLNINSPEKNSQVEFPEGIFSPLIIDSIIGEGFTGFCSRLRMENLYLMVVKLISRLEINKIEADKVFVHSFLDLIFQYTTSELSDLFGFLNFWEEEGYKKSISAAESASSIRILTIHKSKGLEFPVVIIPFADWEITPRRNEILWVEPTENPFNNIDLLPVNITKLLSETYFANDYEFEKYRTLIDNFNLLYVAFTRARNALFVIARYAGGDIKTMGDILYELMQRIADEKSIGLTFDPGANAYQLKGELQPGTKQNPSHTKLMGGDRGISGLPPVRIKKQLSEFLRAENNKLDPKSFGKVLHALMENIKAEDDIEKSIQQFVHRGIISVEESDNFRGTIFDALKTDTIKGWFSGKYTVINENDIIGKAGSIKRPDRIMISGKLAIVVDYKFGKEEDISGHRQQVTEYLKLISEMGFTNVKGYLWYVMENDLEEINI